MSAFTEKRILGKFAPFRGFLYSFFITIFIGVLVGSLSQPGLSGAQRWENLGFWVVNLALGYFAHVFVLLVFLWANKIPKEKTFLNYLPVMISGALFTSLAVLVLVTGFDSRLGEIALLVANVAALSLIVQFFLFNSICYNLLSQLQRDKLNSKLVKASLAPNTDFILLEVSPEETLQIFHESLLMITINDHYLTYYYQEEKKTKEVTIYGSLKTVEEQLQVILTKVNRSTLVNLEKLKDFSLSDKGIYLKGIKEMVKITDTRLKELKQILER
ncbi:MAG: LytTR family DNA-binding domain-containing protein [SAR324 cluster bacterium]|nr:LytTR family DNA-binding domain-containing protein [SAR324 cluster bacterium]